MQAIGARTFRTRVDTRFPHPEEVRSTVSKDEGKTGSILIHHAQA